MNKNTNRTILKPDNIDDIDNDNLVSYIELNNADIAGQHIMNKVLILANHKIYSDYLDNQISEHCISSIKNIISSANEIFFMPYDRDDLEENSKNDIVFYDEVFIEKNNWKPVEMPNGNNIDREASSNIKVIKEEDKDKLLNHNKTQLNFKKNDNNKLLNKNKLKNEYTSSIIDVSRKSSDPNILKSNSKNRTNINFYNHDDKKSVFSYVEDLNLKYEDSDCEIKDFRRETMKEIDIRKKAEIDKSYKIKELQNAEKQKKEKENEKKLKTTDATGNIIYINNYPTEKFTNDFVYPLSIINNLTKEKKELQNPLINKNGSEINNNNINTINSKDTNTGNNKGVNRSILSHHSTISIKKRRGANNASINANPNNTNTNKLEEKPIIPSGSCFDIIQPEVGVVFQEQGKIKKGDNNYYNAFRKFSKYDYDSKLKEVIGNNNLKEAMDYISSTKEESKQINTNAFNNNNNNKLVLPNINNFNNTVNNFNATDTNKNKRIGINVGNSPYKTFNNNLYNKTTLNKVNNELKFNKKQGSSIKNVINDLNNDKILDEKDLNESNFITTINSNNIFASLRAGKDKYKEDKENMAFTQVSNFNKKLTSFNQSLMTSTNWGQQAFTANNNNKEGYQYNKTNKLNNTSNKTYTIFKPDKKELENEIGKKAKIINYRLKSKPKRVVDKGRNPFG